MAGKNSSRRLRTRLGLEPLSTREDLVLSSILVLFLGVFALRLFVENPDQPAAMLYALPISIVAIEYGARAGLLAGGVALALFGLYSHIESQHLPLLGYVTRAIVFLLIGGLVGRLSDRLREAHGAVRSSENQLQAIIDNTTSVISLKDLDGRYLLVNHQYEQVFGIKKQDATGKTDYDLFPKYAADAFRAADRKVLKAGKPLEIEEVAPQKDGAHTYLSIKFPLRDGDGKAYGVCGILTDITERIRADQQVRDSKEQLRQIIDTAHEAFVSIDADSVITGWNRQAEATFGWRSAQAVGRKVSDLIMPERFRERHAEGIKTFLQTGEGPALNKRIEMTAVHRDGHEFPIEIAISTVRTKKGYVFNAFLHDISERKRTEELARIKSGLERQTAELLRSNRELAQFAHVASHDLSEPLQTVSRYVQLLDHRYRGRLDDDADEFIGYAVEGASRMQALVNALNAYSTLGSADHRPEPIDSGAVVDETIRSLRAGLEAADAVVTVDDLPTVIADPTQLGELFQNLISNAVKFVAEGRPEIRIGAERRDEGWCFSVTDNGIGIKPEHRDRVFEMFRRLHGRDRYEGTGIGLTICHKIVARHGGKIWVEASEGGGSSFRFTIPDRPKAAREDGSGTLPVAERAQQGVPSRGR